MKHDPSHISPWYLAEFDRADRRRERAWLARSLAWAIVALVLAIVCVRADAREEHAPMRFEAALGTCSQSASDRGSWWNDHYETHIGLTNACAQIGVSQLRWDFGAARAGWRVAYVDLGRVESNTVFAMRDADQFDNPSGYDCNPATMQDCVGRGTGRSNPRGVTFGLLAERTFGRWNLGAEFGAYAYHNYFTVDIEPAIDGDTWGPYHWDSARGWLATPYIGASAQYRRLFVSTRAYHRVTAHQAGCGGCSGITKGPALQLTVGVQVPLIRGAHGSRLPR
jgi:hypothetical protein